MSVRTASILRLLALALVASTISGSAVRAATTAPGRPIDAAELESFFDPLVAERMASHHVPGVVVVVVQGDRVVMSKGYGVADLERNAAMSPDRTLFNAASTAKLITATAVMQLVESGRIDLDADVNTYLDRFRIESAYGRPVTVRNLLTHTGGFDERNIGTSERHAGAVAPLGEYLARHMPARVMPAGEVISYSNHGYALAGYLVEAVTGVPFERYAAEQVFAPLDMTMSTFEQGALPAGGELATAYEYRDGGCAVVPPIYYDLVPACGMTTTAADMGRFMIAHLRGGLYGERRILGEATALAMRERQFANASRMPGIGFGFYETVRNGVRTVGHGGDWQDFGNELLLFPQHDLGLFVWYNNGQADEMSSDLVAAFVDRYFPAGESPSAEAASPAWRPEGLAGTFRSVAYDRHSLAKLGLLIGAIPQRSVAVADDGTVSAFGTSLAQVEPLLFRRSDGKGYVAFRATPGGPVTHMFSSSSPFSTYERRPWYDDTTLHVALLLLSTLVFAQACVVVPAVWLVRRARRLGGPATPRSRLLAAVAVGVSAWNILFLVALGASLAQFGEWEFQYGTPTVVSAVLMLPFVSAALTVWLALLSANAWRDGATSLARRLYYSTISVAAFAFLAFLYDWNLLGS